MSSEFDRQSLVDIFVTESSEALDALTRAFHPPDGTQPTPSQLQEQYVWAHKIRGAAALYGYDGLALMGSLLESTLEEAPSIEVSLWPKALEILQGVVVSFKAQLNVIASGGVEDQEVSAQWKMEVAELFPTLLPSTSSEPAVLAPDYLVPSLDAEVLSYFIPEANEYLQTMETLLHRLQEDDRDEEAIYRLYCMAHTLKGSAHTIGFEAVCDVASPVENCMIAIREGQISFSPDVLSGIGRAVEVIRLLVRRDVGMVAQLQHEVPDVAHALAQIRNGEQVTVSTQAAAPLVPAVHVMTAVMEDSGAFLDSKEESKDVAASALTDEYLLPPLDAEVLSYFAPEAQEYLESLEAQLLRLEKEAHNKEVIDQLFRTAHTLKGSAYTVGFQSVGDLTHYVEDFMGSVREGRVKILPGHTDMLLRSVDVVRLLMRRDPTSLEMLRQRFAATMQELKQLDQAVASPVAASVSGPERVIVSTDQESRDREEIEPANAGEGKIPDSKALEDREVIRVSRDRLERLLNLVGELVIGRGRLEQRLHMLEQLSQQVLAYKGRLVESVHSFEEKHTFTQPTASSDSAAAPAQGFTGLSEFGSLEFDKYDDFNILARRISEVTADISESMTQ